MSNYSVLIMKEKVNNWFDKISIRKREQLKQEFLRKKKDIDFMDFLIYKYCKENKIVYE